MKYGIAMFPSKSLQDKANSLRKRYDPHYSLIPPHITLKDAFELKDEEIRPLIDKVSGIAEEMEPVKIKVSKFSSFHPANNVIYLKIEDNPVLTKLHENLHRDDFGDTREYKFVPHITVAQKLTDEEHSDVLERLKMKDTHHEEVIDRFQLLYQLDNQSWTVYETFHLK